MFSRREMSKILLTGSGSLIFGGRHAMSLSGLMVLPNQIGRVPDFDGPLPQHTKSLGDRPPTSEEERIAKSIVKTAPLGPTPLDVAEYFLAIAEGKHGATWQPYAQGWPIRWNPVIVEFFQATRETPSGDLTPWCSAFTNWCFIHSGKGLATNSASSGSFRTFGTETKHPKKGDIVVFRRTGQSSTDPHGHVGYFVTKTNDTVDVLGGNQIEGHERSHKVSVKPLAKNGKILTLHSYRTDPRLHGQS